MKTLYCLKSLRILLIFLVEFFGPKRAVTPNVYSTTVLLQNATVITKCVDFVTKCDGYYKMCQFNDSEENLRRPMKTFSCFKLLHCIVNFFECIYQFSCSK